jgi:multicomponent Na+:H+ antiporter subunit D
MKTVIRIYTPVEDTSYPSVTFKDMKLYAVVLVLFIVLNVLLGVSSQPIVDMIEQGLAMFA